MEPVTIAEQLMYSTVRLVTTDGNESGTGFFFRFDFDEKNAHVPILITNKHVVRNNPNETMIFLLHTNSGDSGIYENIRIKCNTEWRFHPEHDLCFCLANPIFEQIKNGLNKTVFYRPVDESFLWDKEKLEELSAIEELTMIGYPIGLWDGKNNFPIFRRGYTASHPAIDFNNEGIGLVDMACFPGSSGSPIFVINESGHVAKNRGYMLGSIRVILLGILFSAPVMNLNGEIVVQEIPSHQKLTSQTQAMVNLGYYIQGCELLKFKPIIREMFRAELESEEL